MMMCFLIIYLLHLAINAQSPSDPTSIPGAPPDMCSCYCCPSRSNPYGSQDNCKDDSPEYVGGFAIGNPASCSSAACNVNFPVSCPVPPVRPPKGLTGGGAMRWGCKSGCRFGPDGKTLVNESARAPGIDGLDNAMYSNAIALISPEYLAWSFSVVLVSLIMLIRLDD
ncbi:hypothetical protein BDV3_000231 [Batrachochytrium dendrobatidis]|nr:hypothetical protein O5D80_004522 [Batrachochytrium dendrobatidis]KAK5667987.1 hypothetical protein QVD99_005034 [Batrachochytrium dendrobatidis]